MISKSRTLLAAYLAPVLLCLATGPAMAEKNQRSGSELEGTWFVLIHYKDETTTHPERERWLDRVWTFAMSGTRLKWTEYPIVVIQDQSGRFEPTATNPRSRVLESWEPNSAQFEEISSGPRVNSRGSKTKTLKGSDTRGWKTLGRRAQVASASVVGYQETWSIEVQNGKRIFSFAETIGTTALASEGGLTQYTELAASPDGNKIQGTYVRDGVRHGAFRMIRTAPIRGLVTSEETDETVNERHIRKNMKEIIRAYGDE
jgi:hypothetical protein